MGLFDQKSSNSTPFGWLVVGLGNPGPKYARTRHNVGQGCVDVLAQRQDTPLKGGRDEALIGEAQIGTGTAMVRAVFAFPITFMNNSGRSVAKIVRRYGIDDPAQIIVVHDELDLEPGIVKLKVGGGLAGHNGLASIAQQLGTKDFLRVRIGVGKPPTKDRGANHVLNRVPKHDRAVLDTAVDEAADAVELILERGIDDATRIIHSK